MDRKAFSVFAIFMMVITACTPAPTLMPTAIPPDSITITPPKPESTPTMLPPTWTPPPTPKPLKSTRTATPQPITFDVLATVLSDLEDYQVGVPGSISSKIVEDTGIAERIWEYSDAVAFNKFTALDGFIAVAYNQSNDASNFLYQTLVDGMYAMDQEELEEDITFSSSVEYIGEKGYAVEFYSPSDIETVFFYTTWNEPGGDSGFWAPVTTSPQYVTYYANIRCNTVVVILICSSLTNVRSYATRLDARLIPIVCRQ
ncbi:MAG: hypothetical protein JXA42_22245 [Anaerolineales bacterium]|nr:hypothetical protein [Anaerolineales bacterium]